MLARCSQRLLVCCLTLNCLAANCNVLAQPADDFIPGFALTLQHETVSDKVSYSPNLPSGEFAGEVRKPRFQSHGFALSYNPNHSTHYQIAFTQRQMNSLRDAFLIDEISAGVTRRIQSFTASRYSLDIGLKARVNRAPEIYKNSYTSYADNLITEVRLIEPRDVRLSLHTDLVIALTNRLEVKMALGVGLSQTSQQKVIGAARLDNDCNYGFDASTQGGSVHQLERCGDLVSFEQHYPTNQTLSDRLGFSVADDITYRDYFFGPELSLHWQQGAWSLGAGYEFRQYFRPALDSRIRKAGDTPVTRSHSAFAGGSIEIFKHWLVDARIRYQQAAFLDDVPFLYNALTHERYRGNGVIRYGISVTRYFN